MKKIALLILLLAFAGAAWVLIPFIANHRRAASAAKVEEDKSQPKPSSEGKGEEEKATEGSLKVEKEIQERLALDIEPLAETKLRPRIIAYGRVIDPSALAALDSELVSADASLQASEAAAVRAHTLFQAGENVARKAVETAESQLQSDRGKARALKRRLSLEWGASIASLDAHARGALLDEFIKENAALIRADVPGGESVKDTPTAAEIVILGREDSPIKAASLAPAATIDPRAQAQGFLLLIEKPPFPVRPGVAATSYLELPGEESSGVVLPRSAIVRYSGEAWVYIQTAEEAFERRRAPAGEQTEKGSFVTEGFQAGEKIVVTGAQALLSTELAPQSTGSAD